MSADHSVIDRALDEIKPPADRRDACRQEIANCINMMRFVHAGMKGVPSPGVLRRNYRRIAKVMEREINFLRKLHRIQRYHFRDLLPHLEEAAKVAKFLAGITIVPSGGRRWDDVKVLAALHAHNALKEYGGVPTLTEGGAFYTLASILYEGATGKAEQDLSPYCRNLGRVSGRYRLRFPGGSGD